MRKDGLFHSYGQDPRRELALRKGRSSRYRERVVEEAGEGKKDRI